jgi:hypothetical protein
MALSDTSDSPVARASRLDTTALSDAMDRLGIAGQCLGIKPLDHGMRLSGRAFTILYGPSGKPSSTVGDYIDDVTPGDVVVLDNGGRENATVWGDILTWVASQRGVGGTVIDGACRDTHLGRSADSRGGDRRNRTAHPRRGEGRPHVGRGAAAARLPRAANTEAIRHANRRVRRAIVLCVLCELCGSDVGFSSQYWRQRPSRAPPRRPAGCRAAARWSSRPASTAECCRRERGRRARPSGRAAFPPAAAG